MNKLKLPKIYGTLLVLAVFLVFVRIVAASQTGASIVTEFFEAQHIWGENAFPDDFFGFAISFDEGSATLAVSALEPGLGNGTGSVYVLEERTGCSPGWDTIKEIVPFDGVNNDYYGSDIALSGDTLAVGSDKNDEAAPNSGAVYIYDRNLGGVDDWGLVRKILNPSGGSVENFGVSVELQGDLLFVGANRDDDAGPMAGAVYIFSRNLGGTNNWGQLKKLTGIDLDDEDFFGEGLAVDGDLLVVGASEKDAGAAYVFQQDLGGADNWGQLVKLTPSDGVSGDEFGISVSINGGIVAAGADNNEGPDGDLQGAVYIYEQDAGDPSIWVEAVKLTASDPQSNAYFGFRVHLNGDYLLASAFAAGGGVGAAYLFGRDTGGPDNWGQIDRLAPSDGQIYDFFGQNLFFSDEKIFVSTVHDVGPAGNEQGSVYVFAPLAANDDSGQGFTTEYGEPFTTDNVLDNDNGEGLSILCFDASETDGQVTSNGDGSFNYIPSSPSSNMAPADTITDTFRYTIQDSSGRTEEATVFVTIDLIGLEAYLPLLSYCTILYADDFSNANSGWPEADYPSVLYEYRNGEYRVLLKEDFAIGGAYPGLSFSDYNVSVDVRNQANRAGTYGLLFGQVTGWSGFYTYEIDNNQHYELWRYDSGWTLLAQGTSQDLNPGTATNRLAIERNGSGIKAYANGVLIRTLTDNAFQGPLHMGVWVTGSSDANLDIRFDDYLVEPIGCGPGSSAVIVAPQGLEWAAPQALDGFPRSRDK